VSDLRTVNCSKRNAVKICHQIPLFDCKEEERTWKLEGRESDVSDQIGYSPVSNLTDDRRARNLHIFVPRLLILA
jgi:hypothetical protein